MWASALTLDNTNYNSLLGMIEASKEGTERIFPYVSTQQMGLSPSSVSTPPHSIPHMKVKDAFYEKLQTAIQQIPANESVLLFGDFNARAGADHASWPTCLGSLGVGSI